VELDRDVRHGATLMALEGFCLLFFLVLILIEHGML
jgi:hypothetical protein